MNRIILLFLCTLPVVCGIQAQPFAAACEARFIYQQNPDNYLIVNFINTSTGNITDYLWDFGDGSTSAGQDPSHAFPHIGEYKVCLTVWNNDTLNPCWDSTCVMLNVDTLTKYNIGGLLFAGNYPINNPTSTGDTAWAILYRFGQGGWTPVDSIEFDTLGYFWFTNITEGKYFLKSGLKPSSARFFQYLPAYHGDCLLWPDADTLLVDHNIYNANIYLVPGSALTPGTGHIHGTLYLEQTSGPMVPLANGEVVLTDAAGDPFYCTYTNQAGEFLFDLMPPGEYRIFGEYTGRFSQSLHLELDDTNPYYDSLELRLYASVPGIYEEGSAEPVQLVIFPNPARSHLNVQFKVRKSQQIRVKVYNQLGRAVLSTSFRLQPGDSLKSLDVRDLPATIYLITFTDPGIGWSLVKKFIKK